jgi:hypothetical protein
MVSIVSKAGSVRISLYRMCLIFFTHELSVLDYFNMFDLINEISVLDMFYHLCPDVFNMLE